jgi:prevent-host-death family protein
MYNGTLGGEIIVPTVSIRDLARRSSKVVNDVTSSGRPAIITRRGKPVGALIAIDPDELEDFVLANAPEYARSMRDADADLARGRTRTLSDVIDEIGATKAP